MNVPAVIYLFKVNNRNTGFGVDMFNLKHISHVFLVFLSLNSNR